LHDSPPPYFAIQKYEKIYANNYGINVDPKEIGCEIAGWICLGQDKVQWHAVMNLSVS
jgi:uncharacterized protein YgfB (UPF0149 family)